MNKKWGYLWLVQGMILDGRIQWSRFILQKWLVRDEEVRKGLGRYDTCHSWKDKWQGNLQQMPHILYKRVSGMEGENIWQADLVSL